MKMILDLFADGGHSDAGGHSVTVYADGGFTSATADKTSDVAKDAEVTITPVMKTGYEVAGYETVAGGVTVETGEGGAGEFVMGEDDVVIYAKSKSDSLYLVTEEALVNVNDSPVRLHRNVKVVLTPNGVVKGVNVESGGAEITMNDAVQQLIDQGILVKI